MAGIVLDLKAMICMRVQVERIQALVLGLQR